MTRTTTLLAAVLFVSAVYATAEVVHHAGLNFFERAMPDGPGCDPSGSAACGVFVQASHPYRGGPND